MSGAVVRILLVEDNPGDSRLLEFLLQDDVDHAYQVRVARSLREALTLAKAEPDGFDIALLDLSLPDSQGLGTAVKLCEVAPNLPIIALTGNEDPKLAEEVRAWGCADFLVKGALDGPGIGVILHRCMRQS